jgi:hypothetical protein
MRDRSRICTRFVQRACGKWHIRVLHCARGGARPRPQRELRAVERLLASTRARPRLEGKGRGAREPRPTAPVIVLHVHAATRHPPRDVRPRATRGDQAHLAPRPLRPRRLEVRLLRIRRQPPHARSRRPALARGYLRMGERRHLVRTLQPSEGRPPARGDEHDAPNATATADLGPVHPARDRPRPGHVAPVPPGARSGRCVADLYRAIARSTASCSSGESATDERPRSRSLT